MTRSNVMKGVIHGRTIELETESGLPDGQSVSVTVVPLKNTKSQEAFEALSCR